MYCFCYIIQPKERLSTNQLLGSKWLINNNALSNQFFSLDFEKAKENVYNWMQTFKK